MYITIGVTIFLILSLALAAFAQTANDVAKRASRSVVLLMMEDKHSQPVSMGSGFLIGDGLVVTNLHVVRGSAGGTVRLVGQNSIQRIIAIVDVDELADLVLLKISQTTRPAPELQLSNVTPQVGDLVYVIGNPRGLEGTFSDGIVSGIRHNEEDTILQITAPISPGSSGGPVLNVSGDVVGVAVGFYNDGQNLNFAIPARYVQLMIDREHHPKAWSDIQTPPNPMSATGEIGKPISEGVFVYNLEWSKTGYNHYIHFSLRNQLNKAVKNITLLTIFYDKEREPIHSETHMVAKGTKEILPGMAKYFTDVQYDWDGYFVEWLRISPIVEYMEVRILDYEIVER